jgi:hypothetical protein
MPLAAIGGLRIRSLRFAPEFYLFASMALRQARKDPACRFATAFQRDGLDFSLTLWDSPAAMKHYAQSGAHAHLMGRADRLAEVFYFHHFPCDDAPDADEAYARWRDHGEQSGWQVA